MKNLSEILLEADQDNSQQDDKNKPVKGDAGTYKEWPIFKTTMKGWVKVMSGQEEAKDTFFSGGFLVPILPQTVDAKAAAATLSKQLDTQVSVKISEYKNDYMFTIIGTKPGYISTGWAKGKGPGISDMIKSMKAELGNKNTEGNDNGSNDNGSGASGASM